MTSPLARATETADIIWQDSEGPRAVLPSLREVDLYSFQGLLKGDGIAKYGSEFKTWQQSPADFQIDGRRPVVELWHRASLAWQQILLDEEVQSCALVVAHNAVNQALVGTAAGIGPQFFRRLLQSNAASTVLDFVPRQGGGPPVVTIDRLNQVRPAQGSLHATPLCSWRAHHTIFTYRTPLLPAWFNRGLVPSPCECTGQGTCRVYSPAAKRPFAMPDDCGKPHFNAVRYAAASPT